MDTMKVMRAYNEYERKGVNGVGGNKVTTPEVIKFVSNETYGSYISYFDVTAANAEAVIRKEVDYFKKMGLNFEWKTYSSDLPENMGELLVQNNFVEAEPESFMALALDSVDDKVIDNQSFVEVSDARGIRDAITVQELVWGGNFEWLFSLLVNLKTQSPDDISIYVVYVSEEPVTSAWITFNGSSPFAGIWGGSTVRMHRNKGHYSLLLNKRIAEAKHRGKKYLTIDASEMSRPIVEKHGFRFIAKTVGYDYENG
jgi:hypothetical protein